MTDSKTAPLAEAVRPEGISVLLRPGCRRSGSAPIVYRIAGRRLLSDQVVDELAPFRSAEQVSEPWDGAVPETRGAPREVYRDRGWVGGRLVAVVCSRDGVGYRLEVEGAGVLWISARGRRIVRLRGPDSGDPGRTVQAFLGPALCLALALQGTFCLHAGAVEAGGVAVALLADSGEGKSTLCSRLARAADLGWQRAADDVLPVATTELGCVARPHFPQLELAVSEQWSSARPEAVPLAGLYVLTLLTADNPLEVERLSARDGALALIRHTVAARLFDAELRSRHLDFSVDLASRLAVRRLRLPRGPGLPDRLIRTLLADRQRALGG